mgnify:CR=1 FL=1
MNTKDLNSKFWKIVFIVAAIYTGGGVLQGIINPGSAFTLMTGATTDDYYTLFFFRAGWLTVFAFGVGYFLVSRNPSRYPGVVVAGGLGKLFFAVHVFLNYASGKFTVMTLAAAVGDVVFVILFVLFLKNYWEGNKA